MADQAPIIRYVGDDWTVGPVVLAAAGKPVDLTGATVTGLFYAHGVLDPVATLTETPAPAVGGVTAAADRTTGVLTEVWVSAALTAGVQVQSRVEKNYPTRTAIVVTDSRGRERTFLLILYLPLDRRSDLPPSAA